jgi:hypothetical protein
VLGAVVAALLAWLATVLIDHTALPNWLDYFAWGLALVGWIVWSFPTYLGGGPRRV